MFSDRLFRRLGLNSNRCPCKLFEVSKFWFHGLVMDGQNLHLRFEDKQMSYGIGTL